MVMIMSPEQVRAARAWLGWSAMDLADHAGVSHQTIARYERGTGTMNAENEAALRQALTRYGVRPTFANSDPSGIHFMTHLSQKFDEDVDIYPEQLRAARAWLGWTAKDLAEYSGVSHPTIARYERNATIPAGDLQTALRTTLDEAGLEPVFARNGEPIGIRLNGREIIPRAQSRRKPAITTRSRRMAQMRKNNKTLQEIGDQFGGLSRQRVEQILKLHEQAEKAELVTDISQRVRGKMDRIRA